MYYVVLQVGCPLQNRNGAQFVITGLVVTNQQQEFVRAHNFGWEISFCW
jgi:hypothetical protein